MSIYVLVVEIDLHAIVLIEVCGKTYFLTVW